MTQQSVPPKERWQALGGRDEPWRGVDGTVVDGVSGLHFETTPSSTRPCVETRVFNRRAEPSMGACNEAIKNDLSGGLSGVWLECGLDRGCRLLTAGDLGVALDDVDLAKVAVQLETDNPLALSAFFLALAAERGVDLKSLHGGMGADPLHSLASAGKLEGGLRSGLFELTAVARLVQSAPGMRAALVSTQTYEAAGALPQDEIAWALATGLCYVRALCDDGFSPESAFRQLRFSTTVSPRFFDGIAKLRALRWTWSKVQKAYGVDAEMALHAESSLRTRTRRDPHSNLLRATSESFAAIVGGANSHACAPYDAVLASSADDARRLARNIPLLLLAEGRLGEVHDPAGGSHFIEALTEAYARGAWSAFQEIEAVGGMPNAVRQGLIARTIDSRRDEAEARVRSRADSFVGASTFALGHEQALERKAPDWRAIEGELGEDFGQGSPESRDAELARLADASTRRDAAAAAAAAAKAVSLGVDAITLGASLRNGEPELYVSPLPAERRAQAWEDAAQALVAYARRHGRAPAALIAGFGTALSYKNALAFADDVLRAGGMTPTILDCPTFDVAGDLGANERWLEAYSQNGAELVVVVCADGERDEVVSKVVPWLRSAGAVVVGVVGGGEVDEGVDFSWVNGHDVLTPLLDALRTLGVRPGGLA
ncbi:MAG: methylmalonyl-CoA mutase family protein [Polyangiales bacterium]